MKNVISVLTGVFKGFLPSLLASLIQSGFRAVILVM